MADRTINDNNTQCPMPQQHVLSVAPLNSMPYIGPPIYTTTLPTEGEIEAVERVGPAMIYFPSNSPREEWEKLTGATKFGIALSGGAATGTVGPILRLMTLGESEDSFYFRVNLPGVSRDEKDFSCDIQPDGKILIKGVTTTGEKIVCKSGHIFRMMTQNLPPPGHFSMQFQLPGSVDPQQFTGQFLNGVLEGVVKKKVT
ncbi:HSP20 domain-containing protein [Cephalotus follicularis]|uniref:HSP20 domain-containing protein n=1 Tax=Cephalotus follicularis TaxID=3775 RepID=A0A1Q3BBG9_CEPFO|nr:HSP20 domain-containing protein [Cephalotus follicularis]